MGITKQLITVLSFAITMLLPFSALAAAMYTTYQAKIIKPDGTPLESTNVNFRFTILDPLSTCVLYTENFNTINMAGSGGLVYFSLGSGIKTFPTSGTVSFSDVFNNHGSPLFCAAGGPPTYSPAANDLRKIVMQFHDGSGWQTLPAMAINHVPYAMHANNAASATTAVTALNSAQLNGKTDLDFVQVTSIPTCSASQALQFNGASFSCVAAGGSGGTVVSVSGTAPIAITGSASAPVISISVASMSSDGYLTAADYAEFKAKLSASSTEITDVFGYAPVSAAAVATQIAAAASSANIADTIVKRDSAGNFTANDIFANATKTNYVDMYKPSTSFNIRLQAPTSLSVNYTLVLPDNDGVSGQFLTTDGSGNLSWTSQTATAISSSDVITALGYTPANSATVSALQIELAAVSATAGSALVKSNNLSDLTNVATARTNLGLGSLATANSIDLGSASATGTVADARLANQSGVTSGAQYTKVTVNAKGVVTSGAQLVAADVTTALGYTPVSSAGASQWTTSGTTINYMTGNVGVGTTAPDFKLSLDNDGSVMAKGTFSSGTTLSASGAGTRMFWYPRKAAFRAGFVDGGQWNDSNVGNYSAAFGDRTTASGWSSFAAGEGSIASDDYAFAMGSWSTASGYNSIAMGESAQALNQYAISLGTSSVASGFTSVAMGKDVTAESYSQITLGRSNMPKGGENPNSWVATDPIFVVGNGTGSGASRSTALMILKNGKVGLGGITTPITALHVSGGVRISMESATCATSYAGTLRYNSGNVEYCNGATWSAFGVAGSGITSLNGSTSGTQSFGTATAGNSPLFSTTNGVHTLNIPLASATGSVTAGLISNADYLSFSRKANNLSDLTSSATARTNLGLGSFATASTIDLGSASATGILAVARLPAFTGDVVTTAGSSTMIVDGLQGRSVAATAPASGQVLAYNGSAWAPATAGATLAGTNMSVQFNDNGVLGGAVGLYWDKAQGYLGIGAAPNTPLWIQTTAAAPMTIANPSQSSGSSLSIRLTKSNTVSDRAELAYIYNSVDLDQALQLRHSGGGSLTLLKSGNVGIGTTNPTSLLHVLGGTAAASTNGKSITISAQNGGTGTTLGGDIVLNPGIGVPTSLNGGVGIGTTPSAGLHVLTEASISRPITRFIDSTGSGLDIYGLTNSAIIRASTGKDLILQNNNGVSPEAFQAIYSDHSARITTNGSERLRVTSAGAVGIGTTAPSEALEVVGSVKATTFITSSDRRLKENIATSKGLSLILNLRGVSYNWKRDGQKEYGLIAQEVEDILPELVETDHVSGLKGVRYQSLVSPLIEATKELYYRCEDQKKSVNFELENLKKKNERLEETVSELKDKLEEIEKYLKLSTKQKRATASE